VGLERSVASNDIFRYFHLANETMLEDNEFMDRESMSSKFDMFAAIKAGGRLPNRYRLKEKEP
jgi:hypothetical protein